MAKAKDLPKKSAVRFASMMRAVVAAFSGWQHARLVARDAEIARLQAYNRTSAGRMRTLIDSCQASLDIERTCNEILAD